MMDKIRNSLIPGEITGFTPLLKGISLKGNVKPLLEFEFIYNDVRVWNVIQYAKSTNPVLNVAYTRIIKIKR